MDWAEGVERLSVDGLSRTLVNALYSVVDSNWYEIIIILTYTIMFVQEQRLRLEDMDSFALSS
jgi:hypothetical protein